MVCPDERIHLVRGSDLKMGSQILAKCSFWEDLKEITMRG